MDESLVNRRKRDGSIFYCPNGHGQNFTESKESTIQKLQEEIKDLKDKLEATQFELRQLKCQNLKEEKPKNLLQRILS